jgi:hypothetical protein
MTDELEDVHSLMIYRCSFNKKWSKCFDKGSGGYIRGLGIFSAFSTHTRSNLRSSRAGSRIRKKCLRTNDKIGNESICTVHSPIKLNATVTCRTRSWTARLTAKRQDVLPTQVPLRKNNKINWPSSCRAPGTDRSIDDCCKSNRTVSECLRLRNACPRCDNKLSLALLLTCNKRYK